MDLGPVVLGKALTVAMRREAELPGDAWESGL